MFFSYHYRVEADKAKELRQSLLDARDEAKNALEKLTNEAKSAKKNLKFTNLESIEARLRELTDRQHTTNMNLREEKELIREIESLSSARNTLQKVKDVEARADAASTAHKLKGKDLNNQITTATELYNAARAKRDAAFEEVKRLQDAHNAELNKQTTGSSSAESSSSSNTQNKTSELIKEKQELTEIIKTKEAALKVFRDEFFSTNREYNNYLFALKRYRQVLAAKEREKAQNENTGDNNNNSSTTNDTTTTDLDEIPAFYAKEINLCDVLSIFLTKLKPKEKTGPTEAELAQIAANQTKRINASLVGLNGEKLTVTARSTGNDDGLFTISSGAKNKKDNKKNKDSTAPSVPSTTAATPTGPAPITLDLEALYSFELLGIPAPTTTADIDSTLVALKNKRKFYETAPPPPHEKTTATDTTPTTTSNVRGNRMTITKKRLNPKLTVGSAVSTLYGPGKLVTIDRPDGLVVVKLEVKETGFYATAILDPDMVKPGKEPKQSNVASSTASSSAATNQPAWGGSHRPTAEVPSTTNVSAPSPDKNSSSPRTGRANRPGGGARNQRKE